MNYSLIIWGLVLLAIGILIFLYVVKLIRKNEFDALSFKFLIASLGFIYAGVYYLFIELSKIM